MAFKNFRRMVSIYRAFARHRCYFFLKGTSYHTKASILGAVLVPLRSPASVGMKDGEKLALVFQELGPAFIKLGQSLSVRPDIVGDDVAFALSRLQDKLPPFPSATVRQIIEKDLGRKISELFRTFDDQAAAAASIAQVHFGRDMDGNEVAIKVLRPGIEVRFFRDINLLYWLARTASKKLPKYRRLRLNHVVATLATSAKIEMDFTYEAAAAQELADNFKNDDEIVIPQIYWQLSTSRVLVMQRLRGIAIDETKKLTDAGLNLDDILKKSVNIFLKQTLRDGFFHADMHPGNVVVDDTGRICVYDFGIMGRIDRKNRIFVAELLLAFLNRDYMKVADLHFNAGIVPSDQSREMFAQACRAVAEPVLGVPQNQISVAKLLQKLLRMSDTFRMETQPQLILLQKTMMMAEGIGRKLNPNVNFWEVSRELIEEWSRDNLGAKAKTEEYLQLTKDTFRSLGESIRKFNDIVTPHGIKLHPQQSELQARYNNSENFWKGFITAIILTILVFLILTKF